MPQTKPERLKLPLKLSGNERRKKHVSASRMFSFRPWITFRILPEGIETSLTILIRKFLRPKDSAVTLKRITRTSCYQPHDVYFTRDASRAS